MRKPGNRGSSEASIQLATEVSLKKPGNRGSPEARVYLATEVVLQQGELIYDDKDAVCMTVFWGQG